MKLKELTDFWKSGRGLSELEYLTPTPLIQNTTNQIRAAHSRLLSHGQFKCSPYTQGLCSITSGEVVWTLGRLLPWRKANKCWKFISPCFSWIHLKVQSLPSHEGSLNSQHAGSSPSFTSLRHVMYFYSCLSSGNFDVQWDRQVVPAWTPSSTSVKSLNVPKTYPVWAQNC